MTDTTPVENNTSTNNAPIENTTSTDSQSVESVKNYNNVKNIVEMKQNPHPYTIILGYTILLVIIYLFWVRFCKNTPAGFWIDIKTKLQYEIIHSRLSGGVYIVGPNISVSGILKHNILILDSDVDTMGMWSENNIFWVDLNRKVHVWNREIQVY